MFCYCRGVSDLVCTETESAVAIVLRVWQLMLLMSQLCYVFGSWCYWCCCCCCMMLRVWQLLLLMSRLCYVFGSWCYWCRDCVTCLAADATDAAVAAALCCVFGSCCYWCRDCATCLAADATDAAVAADASDAAAAAAAVRKQTPAFYRAICNAKQRATRGSFKKSIVFLGKTHYFEVFRPKFGRSDFQGQKANTCILASDLHSWNTRT